MLKGYSTVKAQSYGTISLGLIATDISLAVVIIFEASWVWGIMYLVICLVSSVSILYAFCAKCSCREHCGHVLPGKASGIFKNRLQGPYSPFELIITCLALLLLVGTPQPWLMKNVLVMVFFWMIILIAVIQIRAVVCKACDNVCCPINSKTSKIDSLI